MTRKVSDRNQKLPSSHSHSPALVDRWVGRYAMQDIEGTTDFSSRYSSPKLIRADSYSLTAASDVTEGGFEMISL